MKNKKAEQIAAKQKHKSTLKAKKQQEPVLEREPFLTLHPSILIVCEGKNTEPSYFKQFKLPNATVKTIGEATQMMES